MSKKQEHSAPLSPELIQKYREGKLSPREMHRVERLLLENPFYAEAMEGWEKMGKDASLHTHMADLKGRLQQRIDEQQKTIPMYRLTWQIAAAMVLLVIGSWTGYYFYFTGSQDEAAEPMLSMQDKPSQASEPAPVPLEDEEEAKEMDQAQDEITFSENPTPSRVQESESPADAPVKSAEKIEVVEEQTSPPVLADAETLPPLATQQPDIEAEEDVDDQPTLAISKVPEENIDQTFRSSRMLKSKDAGAEVYGEGNSPFTLQGRVISGEDKSALPGVNVTIKNTGMSTTTDANGDFKLTVPENQNEVMFNYIGFETMEQTVSKSDSNFTVVLTPEITALNEIVIVGYGTQEKKSIASISQARPVVGYSSYKDYLKKNLQYPHAARENNIEGVVNVSFDVNPNGELQRFSVEKPLGYGCDEEAIRLIKEGPAWQPGMEEGKAVHQNVTVKVRFSLKD